MKPSWLALFTAGLLLAYTAVLRFLQHYALLAGLHDFWPPLVVLALFLAAWGGLHLLPSAAAWRARADRFARPLGVFLVLYALYHHFGCWIGWVTTLDQTYWDQLARSFLHGRLYLEAPAYFHDLTFFQGHWYVPNPPLPALLLVPATLLAGPGNVNVLRFSIFFAALNGLLVYAILMRARSLGWIRLSPAGILWLVALFAFGTPHLYVGLSGQMWFLSQTLTVTFSALALLALLAGLPGWLAGASLGLAVLARPNAALLWPLLLAVWAQRRSDARHTPDLKSAILWSLQSGLPVALAAAALLGYNYLRFHDWFDFGYVTINGSQRIVQDAQTYGVFSPHFIPRNLFVMFALLPGLAAQFPYFVPSRDGLNLWLTTPALFYLARRQAMSLWKWGALLSTLLSLAMLAFYHNTGSFQFGYRYLLDFILPVLLLLAAALGEKPPRPFRFLAILSILINLLGAIWFAYNW